MCNYNFILINFLYYFFKYKNIFFFFYNILNNFFKLKLLIFFKRKNIFFHKRDNFKKLIYKKLIFKKTTGKLKLKQKSSKFIDNTSRFLSIIISNRNVIKSIFFKKHTKQKKITKFLINISKKNNYSFNRISNFIFLTLIQSHFFFFINDINFFLQNKFVCVNNKPVTNKFFEIKVNDCIKLVNFNSYYDYLKNIYKYFEKKKSKIKYKQWKNFKVTKFNQNSRRWLPDFLNKFIFYRLDIPKYLEVDFFTLTIIYLYNEKNILYKNKILLKFMSFYLIKMFN